MRIDRSNSETKMDPYLQGSYMDKFKKKRIQELYLAENIISY